MAEKLQKFKYGNAPGPVRSSRKSTQTAGSSDQPSSSRTENLSMTAEDIKADILTSLRGEISKIIRDELKSALAEDFHALKTELKAVRAEIANNATATRSEIDHLKVDIRDAKDGLSSWSDEVATLQTTVADLQSQVVTLKDRCEDMEGRMRRCNIRIVGIDEQQGSSAPEAVSKVIREALHMDRDIKIDRSHRTLAPRKPGEREKPRVIIAKVHYDGDAAEILRRARDRGPLSYNGKRISIFPDYPPGVAKARAAFTDIRKALRGRRGVRYGLLYPARFRISHKDEDKEFVDPTKAMDYVQKIVIPSTEPEN